MQPIAIQIGVKNMDINKYLSMEQLIEKLGNRSRSSINRDVEKGLLPRPYKLGSDPKARKYWKDAEVEAAIGAMRFSPDGAGVVS